MVSIRFWLQYFIFMGIWFVLMNITGTVWQLYELAVHGEIMARVRDSYIVMAMSCAGAIRLKCLLDDWVHDEAERK